MIVLKFFLKIKPSRKIINKKPRHPARVFHIWFAGYNSCRTCRSCAIFLFLLFGASCSRCTHHRKIPVFRIAAKDLNLRKLKRTKQPKFYPQEMGIILNIQALIKFKKSQNRLLFKQFYWRNISKPPKKKPTCFKVGFFLFF